MQKIPDGSIDKYTKDLQMGYFITINTSEWSFVLNYCSASDVADVFSRITGMKNQIVMIVIYQKSVNRLKVLLK